jgi:predicted nuclease of restriction endonuclease-like RecB superfamily
MDEKELLELTVQINKDQARGQLLQGLAAIMKECRTFAGADNVLYNKAKECVHDCLDAVRAGR